MNKENQQQGHGKMTVAKNLLLQMISQATQLCLELQQS